MPRGAVTRNKRKGDSGSFDPSHGAVTIIQGNT
jgi:hypothetical protein